VPQLADSPLEISTNVLGDLSMYPQPLPQILGSKIDKMLLRNMALKCRGFLWRNSIKYPNKWTKCFYCFDIHQFTSIKALKYLNAYHLKEVVFK
jgi:hypothetical protein